MGRPRKFFRPINPSRQITNEFRDLLMKNLNAMAKDVDGRVLDDYEWMSRRIDAAADGGVVQDARPPATRMAETLNELYKKWQKHYNLLSVKASSWFARTVAKYVKNDMMLAFREAEYRGKMIREGKIAFEDIEASVYAEAAALIKTIPQKYLERVSVTVNEAMRRGRDLDYLTRELQRAYGISERRANIIAHDQTAKATESLAITRAQAFGLTRAVWMHRSGAKVPREKHVEASGREFDLREGCLIDGEYIFPAQKINCHCTFRLLFPGEEDEDDE